MGKTIIYQMLPRLWGGIRFGQVPGGSLEENGTGKFSDVDDATLSYIKSLGATHVWYTGILRHATTCNTEGCKASSKAWVKGAAGSPYSITDYFDVNPYLATDPSARMEEFEALVERTHKAGLSVIIDFVPNHVARDYGAFSPRPFKNGKDACGHPVFGALDDNTVHWAPENDFFYYPGESLRLPGPASRKRNSYKEMPAKASGNCYSPEPGINDWYDTIKLNYCDYHTSTWDKMAAVLRFWAGKGVDGFRCDMVELVPSDFCKWLIQDVKASFPDLLFIAEVYQKHMYDFYIHEVGFDILYDKSGLYDALADIMKKNVNDSGVEIEPWQSCSRITWNWQELGGLSSHLLNFLENHDEQRLASDFFIHNGKYALAGLGVSLLFNNSPFMLYSGQETGERGMDKEGMSGLDGRTTIFDWWHPAGLGRLYGQIHGEGGLEPEEEQILERYRSALQLAAEDPIIASGQTYDLCYCNVGSKGFNKDRHFAFLRAYEGRCILVVSNFTKKDTEMEITIPQHAFEWLELKETPLLNPGVPVRVMVKACDFSIVTL